MAEYNEIIDALLEYFEEKKIPSRDIPVELYRLQWDVLSRMEEKDGHYVMKSDGSLEEFDPEKMYNSIAGASDSVGQSLPSGEIDSIVRAVTRNLYGKEKRKVLPHWALRDAVLKEFCTYGYDRMVDPYLRDTVRENVDERRI